MVYMGLSFLIDRLISKITGSNREYLGHLQLRHNGHQGKAGGNFTANQRGLFEAVEAVKGCTRSGLTNAAP